MLRSELEIDGAVILINGSILWIVLMALVRTLFALAISFARSFPMVETVVLS